MTDHADGLDHSSYGGGSTSSAWSRTLAAAASANDESPACTFSSIYGFEWSGAVSGNWYHRNVVFKSDQVPALPAGSDLYPTPGKLWSALDATCTGAGTGCDVLTIPHNGNYSQNGIIFGIPDTITQAQAQQRAKYERVAKVYQHKGNSECKPGVGTSDPECDYEQIFAVNCATTPSDPHCSSGSCGPTRPSTRPSQRSTT